MKVESTKMVFEVFSRFGVGESAKGIQDNANGALSEKVKGSLIMMEEDFMPLYIIDPTNLKLKDGFRASGRQLIGLDGAFMKGNYPGQLLTAVSVDANNRIYPVAYGIVESESKESWTWFLSCLGEDLDMQANSNFTFITDRQKGLLPALKDLFPAAEHRYCVRHIHDNMNLIFKGGQYKEQLWKWPLANNEVHFGKSNGCIKGYNRMAVSG
ncbi:retrovirus-related pol polyprotein [Tanacetum coccineum]